MNLIRNIYLSENGEYEKYHLDEIIGRLIGKEAGLFLDLAVYSTVTENNADSELLDRL